MRIAKLGIPCPNEVNSSQNYKENYFFFNFDSDELIILTLSC